MALDTEKLRGIADSLQIEIKDLKLLQQALTHRSYLGESSETPSNERLEFLGDAVLGLVICQHLFTKYHDRAEGELAKAKAVAVSEPILADASIRLGLDQMILMSAGEIASGGRKRLSILADGFEALVAVIYMDAGLEAAREFCINALEPILKDIERQEHIRDYKSILQELTQGRMKKAPTYVVIREDGADHDKTFVVEARLEGMVLGTGIGKSKKQAEQAAALEALETGRKHLLGENEESGTSC